MPIDVELLGKLRENLADVIATLVAGLAADFPVFDERRRSSSKPVRRLSRRAGPSRGDRLEDGSLDLDDRTFKDMARAYPKQIAPIREARVTLAQLRLRSLEVGSDGRNRCLLSAFRASSSRNQPSNSGSSAEFVGRTGAPDIT